MATYKRGARLKDLREAKGWSHAQVGIELAKKLRRPRPIGKGTVWKWEQSDSPDIELDVFFALADLYGVDARELAIGKRAETPGQGELELTPSGATIGRTWDQLPTRAKEVIAQMVQNVFQLQEEDSDLAALMWREPDPKRVGVHEKRIEHYQATHRVPRK